MRIGGVDLLRSHGHQAVGESETPRIEVGQAYGLIVDVHSDDPGLGHVIGQGAADGAVTASQVEEGARFAVPDGWFGCDGSPECSWFGESVGRVELVEQHGGSLVQT